MQWNDLKGSGLNNQPKTQAATTPWKISILNLKIIPLKRKIIFHPALFLRSRVSFCRVYSFLAERNQPHAIIKLILLPHQTRFNPKIVFACTSQPGQKRARTPATSKETSYDITPFITSFSCYTSLIHLGQF